MKLAEKLLAANADEVLALLVKNKRMEIGEIADKLKCSKASAVDSLYLDFILPEGIIFNIFNNGRAKKI